jgi:hypothetical protein
MDVKRYLEEGKGLEDSASPAPWHTVERLMDARLVSVGPFDTEVKYLPKADARFIADARERLPKYRKALEAILGLQRYEIEAYEGYRGCNDSSCCGDPFYVTEETQEEEGAYFKAIDIFEAIQSALLDNPE